MTTPQDIADRWPLIAAAFASEGVTISLAQALALVPKIGAALTGDALPSIPTVPLPTRVAIGDVQIVNAPDVRGWHETAKISRVTFDGRTTWIEHTKQHEWPNVRPPGWDGDLQSTVWLFLQIAGRWVGSAFIQLWRGRFDCGDVPSDFHINWYYGRRWTPLETHGPIRQGESIGLLVTSGNCRDSVGPFGPQERSNLVIVPASDVADYTWEV